MNCSDAFSPCCVRFTLREAGETAHPAGVTSLTSAIAPLGFWFSSVTVNSFSRFPFSGTIAISGETVTDRPGTTFNVVRDSP